MPGFPGPSGRWPRIAPRSGISRSSPRSSFSPSSPSRFHRRDPILSATMAGIRTRAGACGGRQRKQRGPSMSRPARLAWRKRRQVAVVRVGRCSSSVCTKWTHCHVRQCGGQMAVVAFIEPPQADVVEKILQHCGLWRSSAPRAPPATAHQEGMEVARRSDAILS